MVAIKNKFHGCTKTDRMYFRYSLSVFGIIQYTDFGIGFLTTWISDFFSIPYNNQHDFFTVLVLF